MQQIYLAWHDQGSNPRCTVLKGSMLTITQMRFKLHYQWCFTPLQKHYTAGTHHINNLMYHLDLEKKNVFAWNINWIIHNWLSVKAIYQIWMDYLPLGIDSQAIQLSLRQCVSMASYDISVIKLRKHKLHGRCLISYRSHFLLLGLLCLICKNGAVKYMGCVSQVINPSTFQENFEYLNVRTAVLLSIYY